MCQYILQGQHMLVHTTIRVWVCVITYCNRASSWPKPNPELQSLKNQHSYKVLISIVCGRTVGRYETHDANVGDTQNLPVFWNRTCLWKDWSRMISTYHNIPHHTTQSRALGINCALFSSCKFNICQITEQSVITNNCGYKHFLLRVENWNT
jgi:hypothetical protein